MQSNLNKIPAKTFELNQIQENVETALRPVLNSEIIKGNLIKTYTLIWERCNTAMQIRLEQRERFVADVYNNPIGLLKAIKEHALNYQETWYDMSIISDAV